MRLLVTRPQADAVEMQAHLVACGHDVVLSPLLEVIFTDAGEIELDDVQALVATSKNGLRALARHPDVHHALQLPVYTVGPGTAATARALGFQRVVTGPRAAAELIQVIAETVDVNAGSLLHLAGEQLAVDIAGELQRLGFHVLAPTVYSVKPVGTLHREVRAAIEGGRIDGVILLSPQTARIWRQLVELHALDAPVKMMRHICLSHAVAAALAPLGELPVTVAKEPNLEEILAAVDAAAANERNGNLS